MSIGCFQDKLKSSGKVSSHQLSSCEEPNTQRDMDSSVDKWKSYRHEVQHILQGAVLLTTMHVDT